MQMFIRIEDGKPEGSPQSVPANYGKWVPYNTHPDIDSFSAATHDLSKVYDATNDVVNQTITRKEQSQIDAIALGQTRRKRNQLLDESDWTQLPDVYHSAGKKKEWEEYRQALRDITKDLANITWPVKP